MRQTRHRGRRRVGWMFVFSLAVYTVARYRVWARRHGVLDGGPLPDAAALAGLLMPAPTERRAHEQSLVEPLRERVLALHERGVAPSTRKSSSPRAARAAPPPRRREGDYVRVRDPVTPSRWLHVGDPEWLSMGARRHALTDGLARSVTRDRVVAWSDRVSLARRVGVESQPGYAHGVF